jgi:hypothetical protein
MLFDIEADFLDEDTFTFDIENAIEDLLLDNIIIQEDGDKENKALEEDSEEETITDYQDSSDENNPITNYSDKDNEGKNYWVMDVQAPAFRPRLSGVLAVILEGAAAVVVFFLCVCPCLSLCVCVLVKLVCVCVCEIYTCLEYIYTHIFFFIWLVTMTPGWHRESFLFESVITQLFCCYSRVGTGSIFGGECYHSLIFCFFLS